MLFANEICSQVTGQYSYCPVSCAVSCTVFCLVFLSCFCLVSCSWIVSASSELSAKVIKVLCATNTFSEKCCTQPIFSFNRNSHATAFGICLRPDNVVPLHRNQQTSTQIQIAHGQNYFCPASKPKLPMVKTEIAHGQNRNRPCPCF